MVSDVVGSVSVVELGGEPGDQLVVRGGHDVGELYDV